MKTTLATLTLCLVVLMATGFPFERKGSPASSTGAKEKRVQYAAWDDVNVIAHGLLQLGQGLKEHVDKTKVQMRDISSKLKVFNRTVTELGKESQRLRVEGETLKAHAQGLEDREGQLLNVTAELREKAEEMQQEKRTMNERMSRLEERVDSILQGDGDAGAKNSSDARSIQVRTYKCLFGFRMIISYEKQKHVVGGGMSQCKTQQLLKPYKIFKHQMVKVEGFSSCMPNFTVKPWLLLLFSLPWQ